MYSLHTHSTHLPTAGDDGIVVREVEKRDGVMIDGLKLTMTGEEIRTALDERIRVHERRAEQWRHEANRPIGSQTEEEPLLPTHMCENEVEEEQWRIQVLTFIREHVCPSETYRLNEKDLAFGELSPRSQAGCSRTRYERDNAVGFGLERLSREGRWLNCGRSFSEVNGEPNEA